jgi:hypothetical protein
MWSLFSKYDLNGDGFLSPYEVQKMMEDLGFRVDESYVQETMGAFGAYDSNGDNAIDLEEFPALWSHLGGELPAGVDVLEPEPEPEPAPALSRHDALRKSMLRGHSVSDAVAAVQEGSELTVYLATGKQKHRRFFWVHRSSSNGLLQLCWGKKKGAKKHETETLHGVLPGPDIKSAEELFQEVRVRELCLRRSVVFAIKISVRIESH